MFSNIELTYKNRLRVLRGIRTETITIPTNAVSWNITDSELPLSNELIKKLRFLKFKKLGDLHGLRFQKLLNKFLKVNLTCSELVVELYVFLSTLQVGECDSIDEQIDSGAPGLQVPQYLTIETKADVSRPDFRNDSATDVSTVHADFDAKYGKTRNNLQAFPNAEGEPIDVFRNIQNNDLITTQSAIPDESSENVGFDRILAATIQIPEDRMDIELDTLDISVRLWNVLVRRNVRVLADLHNKSYYSIFLTRNCGKKTIEELSNIVTKLQDSESFSQAKVQAEPNVGSSIGTAELRIMIPDFLGDLPIISLGCSAKLSTTLKSMGYRVLRDLDGADYSLGTSKSSWTQCHTRELKDLIKRLNDGEFDWLLEDNGGQLRRELVRHLKRSIVLPSEFHTIPIHSVRFSARLLNVLNRLHITTLGDLEKLTFASLGSIEGCGKDTVFELWQFTARIEKNLRVGDVSNELLTNVDSRVVSSHALSLNETLQAVNQFLKTLPERNREILLSRFGGGDHQRCLTLEEIGTRLSVTRERVRQIEKKSIGDLRGIISHFSENAAKKLVDDCFAAVCPLTPQFLVHLTTNEYSLFEYPPEFYLRVLKSIFVNLPVFLEENSAAVQLNQHEIRVARRIKNLIEDREDFVILSEVFSQTNEEDLHVFFQAIRSKEFLVAPGDSPDVMLIKTDKNRLTMQEFARQVLSNSDCALTPEEIIENGRILFGADVDSPSPRSLGNLPGYVDGFYLLDRRKIGLRQHFKLPYNFWDQIRSEFYGLLIKEQRPLSTNHLLSQKKYYWSTLTNPCEVSEILRMDSRFRYLGRFLFALDEWGMDERELVKDLIVRALRELGIPLTATEIGSQIQKYRSVSTTTLPALLRSHPDVLDLEFGYFGLRGIETYSSFLASCPKFLRRLVRSSTPIRFGEICNRLGLAYGEESTHLLWRTLRNIPRVRLEKNQFDTNTFVSYQ